ncbi:MAG: type I methionyl aminopeptidase [Planctomycetaceae bacterium]
MITLKSDREIGLMREAGSIVAEAHRIARSLILPGVTTREIDAAIAALFRERNATPLFLNFPGKVPFPAVTCISVNEQVVHGIPGDRQLKEGDIVSVDTGCRLNGWCGDAAWSYPVGEVDAAKQKLLEVGRQILEIAIEEMGRQKFWSGVATAMQRKAKGAGFSLVDDFVGHGIGREMHEDPQVPNVPGKLTRHGDFELKKGLVLAVEPMLNMGSKQVKVLADHWTVVTRDRQPSVHFEHTIALTGSGPELLTAGVGE